MSTIKHYFGTMSDFSKGRYRYGWQSSLGDKSISMHGLTIFMGKLSGLTGMMRKLNWSCILGEVIVI